VVLVGAHKALAHHLLHALAQTQVLGDVRRQNRVAHVVQHNLVVLGEEKWQFSRAFVRDYKTNALHISKSGGMKARDTYLGNYFNVLKKVELNGTVSYQQANL